MKDNNLSMLELQTPGTQQSAFNIDFVVITKVLIVGLGNSFSTNCKNVTEDSDIIPAIILYKSTAGRYRPVR